GRPRPRRRRSGRRCIRRGRPGTGSDRVRALVKAKDEPGLWMEEVPVPEIGPNEVLIQVRRTSICGTDLHIHAWDDWARATIPVPLVIGHEFMGELVEVGSAVAGLEVGDRVAG